MCAATARVIPVQEKYATSTLGVSVEFFIFNSSCVVVGAAVFTSVLEELQAGKNNKIIISIKIDFFILISLS
jgi:hypothetical protein